jgi:hypothetical protein
MYIDVGLNILIFNFLHNMYFHMKLFDKQAAIDDATGSLSCESWGQVVTTYSITS